MAFLLLIESCQWKPGDSYQFIKAVSQKIDSVEVKLSQKIDTMAADLAEHRADTEKHRIEYKVSE